MIRYTLILITALCTAACETSPLGRKQLILFPDSQMEQMGIASFVELKKTVPVSSDVNVNRYVSCVANAVTAAVKSAQTWEVIVFNDNSANAFALPGGKIGVHTGLLNVAANQHQLATVLGHEVAHVLARHSAERVSTDFATNTSMQILQTISDTQDPAKQQLFGLLGIGAQVGILLPFNRTQESESDLMGLDLMASAGFDPRESVKLWRNMAQASSASTPEFLSTHPSHSTRIEELNARIPSALQLYQQAQQQGKTPNCHR